MKKLVLATVLALAAVSVFAQNSLVDEPNPETIGNDSAMQSLREISLDKF